MQKVVMALGATGNMHVLPHVGQVLNLGMVRNFLNQQQNQIQEISRLQEVALQRDLAWGTSKG